MEIPAKPAPGTVTSSGEPTMRVDPDDFYNAIKNVYSEWLGTSDLKLLTKVMPRISDEGLKSLLDAALERGQDRMFWHERASSVKSLCRALNERLSQYPDTARDVDKIRALQKLLIQISTS